MKSKDFVAKDKEEKWYHYFMVSLCFMTLAITFWAYIFFSKACLSLGDSMFSLAIAVVGIALVFILWFWMYEGIVKLDGIFKIYLDAKYECEDDEML